MTRWQVVRQTSHSPDEPVPSGRLGWLTGRSDALSELRAHRLANREQRSGVFYTSRPVTDSPSASKPLPPPPPLPWYAARCKHGTQFLNECDECPGGNPVIPDDQTETDQSEAVQP